MLEGIAHQRSFIGYGLALHAALARIAHALVRGDSRLLRLQLHTGPLRRLSDNVLRLMTVLSSESLMLLAHFFVRERLLRIARLMRRDLRGASPAHARRLHVLFDLLPPRTRRLQILRACSP